MKLQTLSLFCIATILALNVANLCHSQTVPANSFVTSQEDESALVGTWRFSGGDLSAQQIIVLELRPDGTYTKTLAAYVQGARYGGTHTGTGPPAAQLFIYLGMGSGQRLPTTFPDS
jgi:hypothetical protein